MALFDLPCPEFLLRGEKARLIPSVADTSNECRVTSIFLATIMSVQEFGQSMLNSLGVRVGVTSKIHCYTEVVFKGDDKSKIRPDGLIIIRTGNRTWSAIIESKVGKNELNQQQVEAYLDLAKQHGIDAVITISNHAVADPKHHPLQVNKQKTKTVGLYHWSWMHLITEAIMWVKHHGVADSDQGYILTEFVRYLQHPKSGLMQFDRMAAEWKDVCSDIQQAMPVNKQSVAVIESVGSWHQFVRSLSLEMSVALGQGVTVPLKREYALDPQKRLSDDCQKLSTDYQLEADFEVPNAASRIKFCADFKRRTISASMRLKAPEDKQRATARVNWLFRQIKDCTEDNLLVRVIWPSRISDSFATLAKLKDNLDSALVDKSGVAPKEFEIILTRDLSARFKGAQTFVQDAQALLLEFYDKVGQHLREWVATPPKIAIQEPAKVIDGSIDINQKTNDYREPDAAPAPLAANE